MCSSQIWALKCHKQTSTCEFRLQVISILRDFTFLCFCFIYKKKFKPCAYSNGHRPTIEMKSPLFFSNIIPDNECFSKFKTYRMLLCSYLTIKFITFILHLHIFTFICIPQNVLNLKKFPKNYQRLKKSLFHYLKFFIKFKIIVLIPSIMSCIIITLW